jgi:drug/metabolite transporter (DMT)-like permease
MTAGIFALVLSAALLHAGWNALVKQADDPFLGMAAVCLWGGAFAAAVFVALPIPPAAAWPYIVASIALHSIYFWLVGLVYRHTDLSTAYPIMRGSAPLFTFAWAAVALHEFPGVGGLCGILLLAGGIVALGLSGDRKALAKSLPLALTIALSISLYTVIDAEGARLTGDGARGAFAYNGASDAGTGLVLTPVAALWRGPGFFADIAKRWQKGLAGGAAAFFGYGLVVYATTQAPVALVAALRESSVLFAALIGVFAFGEPIGRRKAGAVGLIMAGVVWIRLA